MRTHRRNVKSRLLVVLAVVLIGKVTLSVLIEFRNYIPPRFDSDFLTGRQSYFWGSYAWAFYVHIVSGPLSLVLGTTLLFERVRKRLPQWHRRLGRMQGICVFLLVAPSGLWMAMYAESGVVAGLGLGTLAIATAACVALGWRAVVRHEYLSHQRWMWRTYVLLFSAVVIRVIGGAATALELDADWIYPVSCWTSWLLPLAAFEATLKVMPPASKFAPSSSQ